jgi:hypothetical protein
MMLVTDINKKDIMLGHRRFAFNQISTDNSQSKQTRVSQDALRIIYVIMNETTVGIIGVTLSLT